MLAPDVAVVAGIYQLGADVQVVAALHDPALKDGSNPQVAPYRPCIRFLSLVHEGGVPRHDPQMGQLRQPVDEALGDSVAQVFHVRIGAGIHEG